MRPTYGRLAALIGALAACFSGLVVVAGEAVAQTADTPTGVGYDLVCDVASLTASGTGHYRCSDVIVINGKSGRIALDDYDMNGITAYVGISKRSEVATGSAPYASPFGAAELARLCLSSVDDKNVDDANGNNPVRVTHWGYSAYGGFTASSDLAGLLQKGYTGSPTNHHMNYHPALTPDGWRRDSIASYGGAPDYYWVTPDGTACSASDPGGPAPPPEQETPGVMCHRSFAEGGGYTFVTANATVVNPLPSGSPATDVIDWYFPWETDWRPGARVEQLQIPDLATMPAGGWVATCRVRRTINDTAAVTASRDYETHSDGIYGADGGSQFSLTKAPPPGYTTTPTGTWWKPPPSPVKEPTTAPKHTTPAGRGIGWLSVIALGADWVEKNIFGYDAEAAWREAECQVRLEFDPENAGSTCSPLPNTDPELATGTQLKDGTGTSIASGPWVSAEVIAQVRIDPLRPRVGEATAGAVQVITLTPEQDAHADVAIDTGTGDGRECNMSGWAILNPFNLGRTLYCVFVPQKATVTEVWATARNQVPLVVVDEAYSAFSLFYDRADNAFNGAGCLSFDYRGSTPRQFDGGAGIDALHVHMPAPASAGCPSSMGNLDPENKAGELFGYRSLIRTALLIALYMAVALKTINAFAPGGGGPREAEPVG